MHIVLARLSSHFVISCFTYNVLYTDAKSGNKFGMTNRFKMAPCHAELVSALRTCRLNTYIFKGLKKITLKITKAHYLKA